MYFIYTIGLIYLFLSFCGIGTYLLLTPDILRKPIILLFLVPVCGLLQLAIISVYVIIANKDVTYSTYVSLLVGSVTLYLSLRYRRESIFAELNNLKNEISRLSFTLLFITIALIIVMLPVRSGGFLTTPFRIGIDQVGYTETAQFLLKGGTLKSSAAEIMEQLDTKDIAAAKQNNAHALKFNAYVDSEFLLKALRWGYPAILANLTYVTGQSNVLRIAFIGLIFNYALIFVLTFFFLFYLLENSYFFSVVASLALLLNCNLLNIYYEGQSAQIFGMPILLIMLIVLYWLRNNESPVGRIPIIKTCLDKGNLQTIFFLAFLTAGLLSVYNELIFICFVFLFFLILLDIIFTRSIKPFSALLLTVSIGIGFLLILPLSYKWLHFIIAHLKNVGIAGWWQPQWAFPSEIIGIFDIFKNNPKMGTNLLIRTKGDLLLNIVISELIVAVVLVYITKAKNLDRSFWLSAPLFVCFIFVKNIYIEQIHNYQYMKAYTIFLPLLFIFVFSSMRFCLRSRLQSITYIVRATGYAMMALIILNGLFYIYKYNQERGYVTRDMFDLAAFGRKVDLNSYAVVTHKLTMDEYILAPIIPLNWMNLNFAGNIPNMIPHVNKQVVILMKKEDMKCSTCAIGKYADFILYENPTYLVLDTKKQIWQSFDKKNSKYATEYFINLFTSID